MEIVLKEITVKELADGYEDNEEGGVVGFSGHLDIRPKYQREFVYRDDQRDAVIETVTRNFPLNVMYWAVREEGGFEVIDGQQRTISLCQYMKSKFAVKAFGKAEFRYFHNLQADEKSRIENYKLMVYQCSGTDSEKLAWFETINIAGEELTKQELRNAVYSGTWVTDAKKYFSRSNAPAVGLGSPYLSGTPIRQDYLETVIKWINGGDVEGYMAAMQDKPDATGLWIYFQSVIAWVRAKFPRHRKEMKAVAWGDLYNKFKDAELDPAKLEEEVSALMADEDVTKKRGIYPYVLTRDERSLSIRSFSDNQKREAYERQRGVCPVCGEHFELAEMEADHIEPWSKGGKTTADNCKMLCLPDNRKKSNV